MFLTDDALFSQQCTGSLMALKTNFITGSCGLRLRLYSRVSVNSIGAMTEQADNVVIASRLENHQTLIGHPKSVSCEP
jgi:hypothetical protein